MTGVSTPVTKTRAVRSRAVLAVLMLAVIAFSMLQSFFIPVLSRIQVEFHTDQSTVTWVLTAYLLSATVCTPLLGRLGDVFGQRRMFVISIAALGVGSAIAAAAPTIGWLIAARAFQGVGGGVLPLAFGIARDELPPSRVDGALSQIAAVAAIGFGMGIVIAGPIVENLGFFWLHLLPLVLSMAATLAVLRVIPRSMPRGGPMPSALSAILLSAALTAVLLALSRGSVWGWASVQVVTVSISGAVLAVAWCAAELRVTTPVVDLSLMRIRGVWSANIVTFFVGFCTFTMFAFVPQFLQTPTSVEYGFGLSLSQASFYILPASVAGFLVGFVNGRLLAIWGSRPVVVAGTIVMAAGAWLLVFAHDAGWQILVAMTLQGVGSGLAFASVAGVAIGAVSPEHTGVTAGMNANIRTLGGAIGVAAGAGVVTGSIESTGYAATWGYQAGFAVAGAAAALATVAALTIPRNSRPRIVDSMADGMSAALPDASAAGVLRQVLSNHQSHEAKDE